MRRVQLDNDHCYSIICARDARWDGVFYVGVSSTGIYCRPICPARTPAKERCRFFTDAALAEAAGFRACLRCRPERAPGHAPIDASSRLVRRAIARIEAGGLDEGASGADLAAALGVTERHLRRVFEAEIGVSPSALARTRRVALARQLLAGSAQPVSEVAFAAGFRSERTFRSAFRALTGDAPSDVRRGRSGEASVRIRLDTRSPFDRAGMMSFLAGRALEPVETIDAERQSYRRTARVGPHEGSVEVTLDDRGAAVELSPGLLPVVAQVVPRIRRLFDLDARPDQVSEHLQRDPVVGKMARQRPGQRLPGAFDPGELAMRAVLGQQVSVKAANTLTRRLLSSLGREAGAGWLFPSPADLAGCSPQALREIGLPARRAETLRAIAQALADETIDLGPGADPEIAMAALCELPGIGPWTASYVAMRGLGWPDAFPAGDLAVMRALSAKTPREAEQKAEAWRPWRAYAVMHLWSGGES